jgi:hypothetical protein
VRVNAWRRDFKLLRQLRNRSRFSGDMNRVTTKNGGMKPTFLPKEGSKDPFDFSIAENLFWNE